MWDNKSQTFMSLKGDIRKESVQCWVNIWRNNSWKHSKFGKGHKPTYSRSLANSKQNKSKEIHVQAPHNQT